MGKLCAPRLGALLLGVLLLCLSPEAGAAVSATPKATGPGESVYVAGCPDWSPMEWYNPETKNYEGVLPRLLEQLGQETGLDFTYIRAGSQDQRQRLAENGQVELVFGTEEELKGWKLAKVRPVLTMDQGERVCLGLTKIAGEERTAQLEKALEQISQQELLDLALDLAEERPVGIPTWKKLAAAGVTALLTATSVLLGRALYRNRKARGEEIRRDSMTGLGNRTYFAEAFDHLIPDQYRELYCVAFLGFDISRVNQYYGETEAEEQLCAAAQELELSIRDNEIVARVSGSGFAVARPSAGPSQTAVWLEELLARLNRCMDKYGKGYHPVFRGGLYFLEPGDRDWETVLANARQGYYRAMETGQPYSLSSKALLRQENEKLQMKKRLWEGLRNREFRMFLQPIVCFPGGQIAGAEALSRWDHPQKGLLYPGSYIELMESERAITELDFYIFEEACRQLQDWQTQGLQVWISCNFTRATIDHEGFLHRVETIAGRYTFDRDRLILEITEDTMESNKELAFDNISGCKRMGFQVALDDAGSGNTSFSDLRDYPIDLVKIDRSILNSAVNERGVALLAGMIALAHSLKMKVLCEGVETAAQAELLRQMNCDYMQGYHFYRAMPPEEASRLMNERESLWFL